MLEMSVRKSEVSLGKIEDHLSNDTCPKSLRYLARAKIRPDPDFKTDIKRIRKEAERKMLGALKRFHHRSVERNKAKIRELERKSRSENQTSTSTSTDVKRHRTNVETDVMLNVTSVQRSALAITKVIDLMIHLSLMCELTTNRLKRFNTHTSLPATHQGSVKVSSKAKHLGCFELTLLKRPLLLTLEN